MTQTTPLERQADRLRAVLAREGLMVGVKVRPESGSLLLHREWLIADQPIAVERGYVVDSLAETPDRELAGLLVQAVERMDAVLLRKVMPLAIGRARQIRMTYGDLFEAVSL